jgi:membrane-bound ClpP family serine protease
MYGALAIIGGIVLTMNSAWFHGASTVGVLLIVGGAIWFAFELFILRKVFAIWRQVWKDWKSW